MTIQAYVENGQIVLPKPLGMPNGTKVEVSVQVVPTAIDGERRTINERLGNVIGKAQGLPADFAENHDHYLHGTVKKTES